MPTKKASDKRYRFFVGLDHDMEFGENVIAWSKRLGMAYPAEFIKMVLLLHGREVASKLGVLEERKEDKPVEKERRKITKNG